jgi:DNA-binding PadR family transcriptional regulator
MRLHLLHHASKGPIYGLEMIEELRRHGYRISPGTLYPLLHGLTEKGYLSVREVRNGSSFRRMYRATQSGCAALIEGKTKIRELFGELFREEAEPRPDQP